MVNWFSFLTYILITAGTPGPNTIMSMSNGSQKGFIKGLPFNFGILCGFSIVSLFCTLFCHLLSPIIKQIKTVMLVIGALYILFLAWKTFRRGGAIEEKQFNGSFLSGFLLQFVNVKIYLYCFFSMEVFILPHYEHQTLPLIGFSLFLAFFGFTLTLCWSAFGSIFKKVFSTHAKVINTIMALLLIYCAVSLFFT